MSLGWNPRGPEVESSVVLSPCGDAHYSYLGPASHVTQHQRVNGVSLRPMSGDEDGWGEKGWGGGGVGVIGKYTYFLNAYHCMGPHSKSPCTYIAFEYFLFLLLPLS